MTGIHYTTSAPIFGLDVLTLVAESLQILGDQSWQILQKIL